MYDRIDMREGRVFRMGRTRAWVLAAFGVAAFGFVGVACDDSPGDPCVDFAGNPEADCDGDGLSNAFELAHGYDPANPISNEDGMIDGDHDPDWDGLPNWAEERLGFDPFNPHSVDTAVLDGMLDSDGDGLPNMTEAWVSTPDSTIDFFTPTFDPATAEVHEYQCDPVSGPLSPLMGKRAFRFNSMSLVEPAAFANVLAGMLDNDIGSGALNIIAALDEFEHDRCASYFSFRSGPGEVIDDGEGGVQYRIATDSPYIHAVAMHTSETTAFFRTIDSLDLTMPRLLAPIEDEDEEEPPGDGGGDDGGGEEPPGDGDGAGGDALPGTSQAATTDNRNYDLRLSNLQTVGTVRQNSEGRLVIEATLRAVMTFDDARNAYLRASPFPLYDLVAPVGTRYRTPGAEEDIGFLIIANFTAEEVAYAEGD